MAKPTTYEFPALRVPKEAPPLVIQPVTEEEEWALRQILWKEDYPEEALQKIFRDPGSYYRKLARNWLEIKPYPKPVDISKPSKIKRGPEDVFIMPEEEYEIEIYDPQKPEGWTKEDLTKGWRSLRKEEKTPYVSPFSIEAMPEGEEKEYAKLEEETAVREHYIEEQKNWWKRWPEKKLKERQESADKALASGRMSIDQYANFHRLAQKGLNVKKGKGEELSEKDLIVLAGVAQKDPTMKQIRLILKDDYSNVDALFSPEPIEPMTEASVKGWKQERDFANKDSSNREYLRKRKEQDDILMVHKIAKDPKFFEDVTWAQGVVNKLGAEKKITSKQYRKLREPLQSARNKLEAEYAIAEAGGELAYKMAQHKNKAKQFTFDARMKQYEEIKNMKALWERVVTIWKRRYAKEGRENALELAVKKANSVITVPTMNYAREPKIGRSMIRGDKGDFIWDSDIHEYRKATTLEKLSGAYGRQVIGTSLEDATQKALNKLDAPGWTPGKFAQIAAMGAERALPTFGMPPKSEIGLLYETPFSRVLRVTVGTAESAALTAMENMGSPYKSRTTKWKTVDSGNWIDQFIDQFSLNLSQSQYFPEYFEATLGDVVGKDKAWWGGLYSSMILPPTGLGWALRYALKPTVRAAGTAMRAGGALTGSEKALRYGKEIQEFGSFFNWLGETSRVRRLQHAMDEVMPEQNFKALVKGVKAEHAADYSWKEWMGLFNQKNKENQVNSLIIDRMAERQSGIAVIQGLAEGNRLTEDALDGLLHNRDIATLWLKSNKDMDTFKKTVATIWENMERAALKDDIARRAFNEANHVKTVIKNMEKIQKTQKIAPWLEGATPLSKEFNDALFVRMVEGAKLSDKEMEKLFSKIADLPKEERTGQKMAEILIEVRKFKVEPVKKPQVEGPSIIYPPGSRPPPAPSLPPVSLAPWDASLRQMEGALRDVLNNTIGEKLMDYLPYKDVHSLNGGVFQRSARLSDKKSQAAFKKEYDSLLGIGKYTPSAELKELSELKDLPIHERLRSIEAKNDPGMVSLVSYKLENNTGIFDVMTKELGPSNITASNYYIDLLKKIKDNEPLSQFDFWNVKNTVAKHLNKKHFDAFELTELGRQAQRAKTEMAGIIPTATTRGRSKTPSTIAFSPLDLARSLKTLQKKPVFPVKDPYAQGDLKINEMLQRVDQASTNIEDAYADDIKMTMNRLKKAFPNAGPRLTEQRAVMALDEVTARVWNTEKVDVDKSLDAFVQRHHDGSYKKMVESGGITTTEGRDLIHGIKSHAEDAIERGMGEEEAYKKWAREYNAFMYKRDAWERIINQYYGIEIKTLVKEGNAFLPNTFHKLYDENVEGLVSGTVAFDTYSANILDPTLTNLNMVVRRINTKRPQFAEKGLITTTEAWKEKASDVVKLLSREKLGGFNAERATSAALHPWAIGTLQSQMVRREIAEFAMTNPTKVVAGVLNPLAGSTLLDPKPLHAYYKGMFEDLMKSASKGGTSFVWDKLVKRGIDLPILRLGAEAEDVNMSDLYAEAMTKAHLSALQKVTYEDRINILAKASQPETRKATLYPNLSELIPIFQFNLKEVLNPFSKESKNIFKTLVGRMDIPDAAKKSLINDYVNRVQRSMNATMVGEGVVKAPFQSGAQYTVMGDTTRAWKNIQRAGGSVVGDDLKDVLGSLSSSYKRLAGTNYFAAYGDELKDAMRNLSELAGKKKLDFVSDRLRNDKWSRLAVNTAADFAEGIRTSTISGLLGGWGLWPGFRYLGVNLLTAPIIATAAAGKHGLGTINPQMNYISIGLNGMPVDKVVFETPKGIPYTAGELRYIQGMANKGFSQENLYFATNNAKKIMRDLGLTLKGLPKGKFRSFVEKNLLPTNMNMWSRLAMDTDRHFRNTVRMQGLKNGLSVEAANKVAKKAMLDYGAPSKLTASYASKLILFWRFQIHDGSRNREQSKQGYSSGQAFYCNQQHESQCRIDARRRNMVVFRRFSQESLVPHLQEKLSRRRGRRTRFHHGWSSHADSGSIRDADVDCSRGSHQKSF